MSIQHMTEEQEREMVSSYPIKPKSEVYVIMNNEVKSAILQQYIITADLVTMSIVVDNSVQVFSKSAIGDTVFETKEEAEKKLEKTKESNNPLYKYSKITK